LVELIVRFGRENRSWGCVRIQGELRKLGIRVSATSVRRVLGRVPSLPGPQPAGHRLLHRGHRGAEAALRAVRHRTVDPAGAHPRRH
jgi:hypothetical protein